MKKENITLTPSQKGKYTRLANIKRDMKALEAEGKKIQEWIFSNVPHPVKSFTLAPGEHLCLAKRENWVCGSNEAAISVIGEAMFMKMATISKAKIAKAGGETAVTKLKDSGDLTLTKVSKYYSLRSKC